MNPTLAKLYGLSGDMPKTASDTSTPSEDTVDLSQISAADFLAALQAQENEEPSEPDLSQMSAEELIALVQSDEGGEGGGEGGEATDPVIEKMAQDGSLEYWDRVGRVLAHSFVDENEKIAAAEDELISVEGLTAQQLVDAIESGEYELVDPEAVEEAEKVAGSIGAYRAGAKHMGGGMGSKVKAFLHRATGGKSRDRAKMLGEAKKGLDTNSAAYKAVNRKQRKAQLKGYGGPAAAVGAAGAAGAGGFALKKKKEK